MNTKHQMNKAEAAPAQVAQPKELQWVNLRDSNGRASSLCLNCRGIHPGHFVITGNLEHGATIRCDTHADAVRLADHVTRGSYSELLEALKECRPWVRKWSGASGFLAMVDNAIAKATEGRL